MNETEKRKEAIKEAMNYGWNMHYHVNDIENWFSVNGDSVDWRNSYDLEEWIQTVAYEAQMMVQLLKKAGYRGKF